MTIKARLSLCYLKRRTYAGRRMNFYFLSTGRVGTRFFAKVLGTAPNAYVRHQPSPQLKHSVVREVVSCFVNDPRRYESLSLADFPRLEEKIMRQLSFPFEVYGDTLNHMFPFGLMLYKYFGPEKLRLIHLIRHPVGCGRSILKSERDDDGQGRFEELRPPEFLTGKTPAEKAADIWNGVNGMIRTQFEIINNPSVCRVFRLEDVSRDSIKDLFDFLCLKGWEENRIAALMADRSHDVRHSHIRYPGNTKIDATKEELASISKRCAPLARLFGYEQTV